MLVVVGAITYVTSWKANLFQLRQNKCVDERKVGEFVKSTTFEHLKTSQVSDRMMSAGVNIKIYSGKAVIRKLKKHSTVNGFSVVQKLTLQQLSTLSFRRNLMCLKIICMELSVTAMETPPKSKKLKLS